MYYSVLNIYSSEFYNLLTGNYKADFRVAFFLGFDIFIETGSRSTTILSKIYHFKTYFFKLWFHFNYHFLINNRTKPLETKYYFKKIKHFFLIIYYSTVK